MGDFKTAMGDFVQFLVFYCDFFGLFWGVFKGEFVFEFCGFHAEEGLFFVVFPQGEVEFAFVTALFD